MPVGRDHGTSTALVQHGWTAVSPVQTHFRDFPKVGLDAGSRRRLLVWSHESRAWDPREERHTTTPVGAQFAYLARAAGPTPKPRDERDEVVLMPVHGIQTQRVRGDHAGLARLWREQEGPATACLYAADAADPDILGAYTGRRPPGRRAGRADGRGVPVAAVDDARPGPAGGLEPALDPGALRRAPRRRPRRLRRRAAHRRRERRDERARPADLARAARPAPRPGRRRPGGRPRAGRAAPAWRRASSSGLLGWRGLGPTIPATEFWTTSVVSRAVINLRRRADAPAAPRPTAHRRSAPTGLAFGPWLRAAMCYLPRPLPRSLPTAGQRVEPIEVRPTA